MSRREKKWNGTEHRAWKILYYKISIVFVFATSLWFGTFVVVVCCWFCCSAYSSVSLLLCEDGMNNLLHTLPPRTHVNAPTHRVINGPLPSGRFWRDLRRDKEKTRNYSINIVMVTLHASFFPVFFLFQILDSSDWIDFPFKVLRNFSLIEFDHFCRHFSWRTVLQVSVCILETVPRSENPTNSGAFFCFLLLSRRNVIRFFLGGNWLLITL